MNKNFEQMLRLVDYVDGLMVVDKNCIIRHYYTAYPELVNLRQDEPLNRSLFEIYPSLKREDSYICRALETGESFINYEQTYINYKGDSMEANCSAVPIKEHGEVVGVIDMVIYKDAHVTERRLSFDISLISALTKSYNTSDQSLEDIVTQDGEMIRIKEKILQTADSDAHVLVYGKTGTGKELIVNAIQKTSRRKDAPFIKQNCASIPSTLLESILFGTTKGSYTGAKDTPGLFELADGGTLFLDEINSMELTAQAKLLRVLEERYFAYTAMTCARDGIFLSWSEESLDGSPLAPSVMVREVLAVFPQAVCRKASAEEAGFYALNEKTALHVFGSAVDRSSSKAQALGVFLEESAYTESYQRIRHPVQPELFAMKSSETARTLFGGEMRLSPSKLDRYHQCRFAYFCERGLGIKKPRKAQLSPMESGTVIHYVLQKVISKYPGKELCSLSEEQCRKLVRQSLDDYLQDAMGGELDKTARFRYLFTRMANTLVRLIHHLAMEFAVCDFEPVAFELVIAKDSSVTPLELEMPDGGKIWVEGIVDRVDVMEKRGRRYVRVVDYKTGTKTFDFTDIYYGINLQMLVYLFSICQNGKGQLENTVPAGILYMPGKTGFLPADRHAEEEQMQAQQKRALKMNGLLLSDPVVLEGMESDGAGVFIPAKLKDGQIDAKSSVATLEELGKLKRHIESLLRQMAQTLWKGDIPALPLEEKQFDLCAWCDYRGICGREEDGPKRQRDEFSREVFFQKIGGEEDA